MKLISATAIFLLAATSASFAQSADPLNFTRVTVKGSLLDVEPQWHVEIYRDDAYQFFYRNYGADGKSVPGLFAHDLIRDRWLEITDLSTENARLGRSPDFSDIPLAIVWNFEPLARTDYAHLPLQTSASIVFPDRIIFFSAVGIYRLDCNSKINREMSLTSFWVRKADLDAIQRRAPQQVVGRESRCIGRACFAS